MRVTRRWPSTSLLHTAGTYDRVQAERRIARRRAWVIAVVATIVALTAAVAVAALTPLTRSSRS